MTNDYSLVTNAVLVNFTFICRCSEIAFYNNKRRIYTVCVIPRKLIKSFANRNIDGRSKPDLIYFY